MNWVLKNSTYLVTSTFRQAYKNRNTPQQLMLHSDQGPQYTSNTFRKLLRMNKVVQSFSKSGRPHDNAVAESFFASMKREEVYRTQYCSEHQFMRSVDTYIEFYNTKRPHSTLNYKTPDRFELLHAQRREQTSWSGQRVQNWVFFVSQPPSSRLSSLAIWITELCMRKEKAWNNKAFSHKTRIGVLDSLRKLFNTPTLIHLERLMGVEPTYAAWEKQYPHLIPSPKNM